MSSVQHLREFISQRLTAAAEEILGVFVQTIEEEVARQSKLLDLVWKPEVKLHRIELPQQPVCRDVGVPTDQERNSSLDQEEPEPLQIKEEQEETCTSQDGAPQKSLYETRSHSNNVHNSPTSKIGSNIHRKKNSLKCDICGKVVKFPSDLKRHMTIHTGEKPYVCITCGKSFAHTSGLKVHIRIHTGVKPYSCPMCGKGFVGSSDLKVHIRTHTGEKPYSCQMCGKSFVKKCNLIIHKRTHTGEKPYPCGICEKRFSNLTDRKKHGRVHRG